jgi:CRISPR type III-A-associated RAMP protein Csm5
MSRVKIETLTPVHIGSGNKISKMEMTTFIDGEDSFIGIVSPEKVINLIGEQNISNWISFISQGKPLDDFVRKFAPKARPTDYISRSILVYDNGGNELKECLHNGAGQPYIPGSSIKGAIRTAVIAHSVAGKDYSGKIEVKGRPSAKQVEFMLTTNCISQGDTPNSDFFRFLKIGDAYFDKDCEIALMAINLNIRSSHDSLIDESKKMLTEAICAETETTFSLKIDKSISDWCSSQSSRVRVKSVPDFMGTVESLFDIVNNHTKSLLQSEIEYWHRIDKDGATDYIDNMEDILSVAKSCSTDSCVLRIGAGSGWRFMTGAWTEKYDNFESFIVPASRPRNAVYQDYDFPKSRRIDRDGSVFGFVKLTKLD